MGWTQEMQSHWCAFQASRLRFGCWAGGSAGLGAEISPCWVSSSWETWCPNYQAMLYFFWYIGTFHSKEFRNVYCGKVKFFYKQYCFCNFTTLLKHANNLLCVTVPAVIETEWTVVCLCVVQFICCRLQQIVCVHLAYIVSEILQQGRGEEEIIDAS